MNTNPYASPFAASVPTEAEKSVGLFTSSQVALATFLASPLAGVGLMVLNELRKNRTGEAIGMLVGGVMAQAMLTLLCVVILPLFPFVPPMLMILVNTFLMKLVSQDTQGVEVDAHVAAGGSSGSAAEAIGVGFAALAVAVGMVFGLVWTLHG